jgi:hypothetical protein
MVFDPRVDRAARGFRIAHEVEHAQTGAVVARERIEERSHECLVLLAEDRVRRLQAEWDRVAGCVRRARRELEIELVERAVDLLGGKREVQRVCHLCGSVRVRAGVRHRERDRHAVRRHEQVARLGADFAVDVGRELGVAVDQGREVGRADIRLQVARDIGFDLGNLRRAVTAGREEGEREESLHVRHGLQATCHDAGLQWRTVARLADSDFRESQ